MFPMMPSSKLHKWFRSTEMKGRQSSRQEIFKMTAPEPLTQIHNNLTELFLINPLPKLHKWLRSAEQKAAKAQVKKYL